MQPGRKSRRLGTGALQGGQGVAVSQVSDGMRVSPGWVMGHKDRVWHGQQKAFGEVRVV